jgi:hypothetical protein
MVSEKLDHVAITFIERLVYDFSQVDVEWPYRMAPVEDQAVNLLT